MVRRSKSESIRDGMVDAGSFRVSTTIHIGHIAPTRLIRLLVAIAFILSMASCARAGDFLNIEIFDKPHCSNSFIAAIGILIGALSLRPTRKLLSNPCLHRFLTLLSEHERYKQGTL